MKIALVILGVTAFLRSAHAQEARKVFEVPFAVPGERNSNGGGLALSPDSQTLAVGQSDRAVHLLRFPSGQEVRALAPLQGVPRTMLFSPDGQLLAVHAYVPDEKGGIGGSDLAVFAVQSGALVWQTRALLYFDKMAFWTDAHELAVSGTPADKPLSGRDTLVFDLQSGQEKRRLGFEPLALGNDGRTMLTQGNSPAPPRAGDGTEKLTSLLVQDLNTPRVDGKRVGIESKGGIQIGTSNAGGLSADGSRMIAVGLYNAKLFDARTGDYLATFPDVSEYASFDFSRDGRRLIIPDSFGVRLIDSGNGDALANLRFPPAPPEIKEIKVGAVADLSDDGQTLVAAVPISATRRAIYAYDLTPRTTTLQTIAPGLAQFAVSGQKLALSPDGQTLVSAGQSLVFLQAQSGARLRSPAGADSVGSLVWSRDGKHLLFGGTARNTVQWWDAATFSVAATLGQHEWPIEAVALSPDGALAAAGGSGFTGATRPATRGLVSLFETASGKTLKTLTAMTARASALEFSPDGKWLAIGADDGTLDIWNVAQTLASPDPDGGKPVAHLEAGGDGIAGLSWSAQQGLWVLRRRGYANAAPPGAPVEGVGSGLVNVVSWSEGRARTLRSFGFASNSSQNATAFALSSDARVFATGESQGYDAPGTLWVRDAQTGAKLASLPINGQIKAVAFAPDGQTLYFQFTNAKGGGALQKWTWR